MCDRKKVARVEGRGRKVVGRIRHRRVRDAENVCGWKREKMKMRGCGTEGEVQ